jgi:hypothetical protein
LARAAEWARDLGRGIAAGAAGTVVLDRVSRFLYERESPGNRQRYEAVTGGRYPTLRMAEKVERLLGLSLTESQRNRLSQSIHWGTGLGAGAAYALLRRRVPAAAAGQGLLFGIVFFLLVDELLNTVAGAAEKPTAYPWQAHARGLATHAAYGLVADSTLDILDRVA